MAIAPGMITNHNFTESCHIASPLLHCSFLTCALNGCLTLFAVLPIYVLVKRLLAIE